MKLRVSAFKKAKECQKKENFVVCYAMRVAEANAGEREFFKTLFEPKNRPVFWFGDGYCTARESTKIRQEALRLMILAVRMRNKGATITEIRKKLNIPKRKTREGLFGRLK